MKRRKRPPSSLTAVGTLLEQVLGGKPRTAQKIRQHALWPIWEQVVGSQIAAHAQPVRMQGTVLILAVSSPSWVQELTMMRRELLAKIHEQIDPLLMTDIRCELRWSTKPIGP
ncbi:MAG: DUF721 domain-containing protein [Deltaproteobacteria bacterium]|nr:DUF721 domain-containing protein [Deltaproteobacteria bacterium]